MGARRKGFDAPRKIVPVSVGLDLPVLSQDKIYRVRYRVFGVDKDWFTTYTMRYASMLEPHIRKRHRMGDSDKIELIEFIEEGDIIK